MQKKKKIKMIAGKMQGYVPLLFTIDNKINISSKAGACWFLVHETVEAVYLKLKLLIAKSRCCWLCEVEAQAIGSAAAG